MAGRMGWIGGLGLATLGLLSFASCSKSTPVPPVPAADESDESRPGSEPEEVEEDDGPLAVEDAGSDSGKDAGPAPTPIPSKIRYVVVIVKENHSFDNYFSGFPGATSATTATLSTGAKRKLAPGILSDDICHSLNCGLRSYANGKMNGFDLSSVPEKKFLPFVVFDEPQIPNYWTYARNFVLADHHFASSHGPSARGHITYWAAQPLVTTNPECTLPDGGACEGYGCDSPQTWRANLLSKDGCSVSEGKTCFDVPVLVDHLPAGFTWRGYARAKFASLFKSIVKDPNYTRKLRKGTSLFNDLKTAPVPNLIFYHASGAGSEHPPQHPCNGENESVEIINALMKTPEWKEMAIILTYDDTGGFYDSVVPPTDVCPNGKIFGRGFRVPLTIISPYAKKGFVLKTQTEQASVPKLIEDLWGMSYMTARDPRARDGVAGSLMGAFDFNQPPRPPLLLTTRTCK